jgi:hypothetical protein
MFDFKNPVVVANIACRDWNGYLGLPWKDFRIKVALETVCNQLTVLRVAWILCLSFITLDCLSGVFCVFSTGILWASNVLSSGTILMQYVELFRKGHFQVVVKK